MVPCAPVVKWISQQSSELLLGVRVLPGAPNRFCFLIIYGHVAESGIRVRLRSVWSNPWEFKSPRAHLMILRKSTCKQLISGTSIILGAGKKIFPTRRRKKINLQAIDFACS